MSVSAAIAVLTGEVAKLGCWGSASIGECHGMKGTLCGETGWFNQAWLDLNSIVVTCKLMAHPDILMCPNEEREAALTVFQASNMISARLKS